METRYVLMGDEVCQWKVRVDPLSTSETSTPFDATMRLSGTVQVMSKLSALSSLKSLQGHQSRAPKGSLKVQIMGCPECVSQPKEPPAGLPEYVTVTTTVSF